MKKETLRVYSYWSKSLVYKDILKNSTLDITESGSRLT